MLLVMPFSILSIKTVNWKKTIEEKCSNIVFVVAILKGGWFM
jgi:hypothetical protein